MATQSEAAVRAAASAIVEAELRGPIALVTDDRVRLRTDGYGNARLPMQPVVAVTSIAFDNGTVYDMTKAVVDGNLVQGLPFDVWATFTYTHGWDEAAVPAIVRTIVDSLEQRMASNQDDALRAESIGSYRVEYQTSARWLTDDEKLALQRCSRSVDGTTAVTSTAPAPPPDISPFLGVQ